MMKQEQREKIIERLRKGSLGKALREEFELEKVQLMNIANATSWEDTLARQHAVKIIDRILHKLRLLEDNKENDSHNEYE